jgi:hypothetical protein
VDPIRASIAIRACIEEALERWSEDKAPGRAHQADFESLDSDESRITVEAWDASLEEETLRRALHRHLLAFKRRLEGRDGTGVALP